jgi:hypothetical protein
MEKWEKWENRWPKRPGGESTLRASIFMRNEYDSHTAITFLLVGLGMGALLALFLAPHPGLAAQQQDAAPELMAARRERVAV